MLKKLYLFAYKHSGICILLMCVSALYSFAVDRMIVYTVLFATQFAYFLLCCYGDYKKWWMEGSMAKDAEKTPCAWCNGKAEYTIIDDDFGQPLRPSMIHYCFNCGRKLREDAK